MAERKFKLPLGSTQLDVTEVNITGRTEGVSEYQLEDGSVIRLAVAPTQVIRIDGAFDNEGNPTYIVRHGTVVTTISAPQSVRRQ